MINRCPFVRSSVRASVTSFSRDWLISFFWFLAQRCIMAMPKNMTEPDFRKKIISGRKCRKYAEKTGFLAFSRDFIICFYWFFAQRRVLAMPKIWLSPIPEKNFFPAENAGNMPEKPPFWHFPRDSVIIFFLLFAQRCVLAMFKTWPSPIFENNFFRPKMPEICRQLPFLQILFGLFLILRCFFTENVINSDANHLAWFICQ